MMYGPPPEYPRATNSPTIILLVAGLAAVLGFLLGVFVGFGAGESSAAPAPTVTVTAEDTDPPTDPPTGPPTDQPTGQPQQSTDPGPARTGPTQPGPTGPAPTGPAQTGPAALPTGSTGPAATMRTLVVGVDIQPGTYRTTGPVPGSTNCFWARLNSTSPSPAAVIDAGAPNGPASVTIQPADKAFQTAGCAQWTKV
ncbi:MAG: hypothetical protein HOQ38_15310 [Nonomuraea sp.]|nr:hypothetical protein [Nonomuraea sp.]